LSQKDGRGQRETVTIGGPHFSIRDEEALKFGVFGRLPVLIKPRSECLLTAASGPETAFLFTTGPLGNGAVNSRGTGSKKRGTAQGAWRWIAAAVKSDEYGQFKGSGPMKFLKRRAWPGPVLKGLAPIPVHSSTDVTGFGPYRAHGARRKWAPRLEHVRPCGFFSSKDSGSLEGGR